MERTFREYVDEVKRAAPTQANRIQSIVCGIFNWAVESEILDTNPIAGLRKRAKEAAAMPVNVGLTTALGALARPWPGDAA